MTHALERFFPEYYFYKIVTNTKIPQAVAHVTFRCAASWYSEIQIQKRQ